MGFSPWWPYFERYSVAELEIFFPGNLIFFFWRTGFFCEKRIFPGRFSEIPIDRCWLWRIKLIFFSSGPFSGCVFLYSLPGCLIFIYYPGIISRLFMTRAFVILSAALIIISCPNPRFSWRRQRSCIILIFIRLFTCWRLCRFFSSAG